MISCSSSHSPHCSVDNECCAGGVKNCVGPDRYSSRSSTVTDRQTSEYRDIELSHLISQDVDLGPVATCHLIRTAIGVLADGDSNDVSQRARLRQHRQLSVDVSETKVERLEQQDRSVEARQHRANRPARTPSRARGGGR